MEKINKKGWERFMREFVYIPPPESGTDGKILLRPFEIKGSVYDIVQFIDQEFIVAYKQGRNDERRGLLTDVRDMFMDYDFKYPSPHQALYHRIISILESE